MISLEVYTHDVFSTTALGDLGETAQPLTTLHQTTIPGAGETIIANGELWEIQNTVHIPNATDPYHEQATPRVAVIVNETHATPLDQ